MNDRQLSILVVDDETSVRQVLRKCFETESYRVVEAYDRQTTLDVVHTQDVDLITLDINLNGQDGLSIAREIRLISNVPIIMVSGKGELIDTVVGLEVGADDYIAKPFQLREVLARVKSVLRRSALNAQALNRIQQDQDENEVKECSQLCFGNYKLCPASRNLIACDGTQHELTTTEFNLLTALASHSRQVMSRDQIMDAVKGTDWNPTDRTIDNQIARLRKKLETLGVGQAIKTVRGIGYQFTLPAIRQ